MTSSEPVVVHQTVHGYRAGHELLQASRPLPQATQRAMVLQSDLSGPSVVLGFEEYLTGYPLDEIGTYAFARTWYAAEMRRPGCVWTQSLLVDFADLARIGDLSTLVQFFERPTLDSVTESGIAALTIRATDGRRGVEEQWVPIAAKTLEALYSSIDRTTIISRDNAQDLESLVLVLWSQQWPRLRRVFRFCTGALSARAQEGASFDLMVVPNSLERTIRRQLPKAAFVDEDSIPAASFWISAARETLVASERDLDVFFATYGADAAQPRRAWQGLLEAFQLRRAPNRPITAFEIVNTLALRFPGRSDGLHLKDDALWGEALAVLSTHEVLALLATCEDPAPFEDSSLHVLERSQLAWQVDRDATIQLLRTILVGRRNRLGEQILNTLCDRIDPKAAVQLERTQPGLLSIIVSRKPALAGDVATWDVPLDTQRQIVGTLATLGEDPLKVAFGAVLRAGRSQIATDVARALGTKAADVILNAFDSEEELVGAISRSGWRAFLAENPDAVVQWVARRQSWNRLAVAASALEPDSSAVRAVPVSVWVAPREPMPATFAREGGLRLCAFLLALGLATSEPSGARLIRSGYPLVFDAARAGLLRYDLWRWLEHQLPPISWWRGWDWCERLSFGLVDRFSRFDWPLQAFIDAIEGLDAFRQALAMMQQHSNGDMLRRRVVSEAELGALQLSDGQRQELYQQYY